jgi:beta-lactamase regulating signal transducer with metallopeptidase domain
MTDLATALLGALLRTTLFLSVAFLLVGGLLWLMNISSPAIRRSAWVMVLLQGWWFGRSVVDVPWYEPDAIRSLPAAAGPSSAILESAAYGSPVEGQADLPAKVEAPSPAGRFWNWQCLAGGAWLAGILATVTRWAVRYVRFARDLPLGEAAPAEDQRVWDRLLAERNIQRAIPLRMTDKLGPALWRAPGGYRVLAPRSLWRELLPESRLAILRHELAHYERGDLWKSLVVHLLALPQWFNPFAWRAVRNFDEAAEWACDDQVRKSYPEHLAAYGRGLLLLGAAQAPRGLLNTAARGRGLALRIRRLLAPNLPEDSHVKKTALMAASLALLLAGGIGIELTAREAADTNTADTQEGGLDAQGHFKAAKAMLEAAAKTYEATAAGYDAGTAPGQDVYVWSRRWLDAERSLAKNNRDQLAALTAHWERMRALYRRVEALYRHGSKGGELEKYFALRFYVAEAELFLADAGGAVPEETK